jgi:integrase
MKFNAKLMHQLEPGANVSIDGFPGLRMAVTANTRTWTYRYRSPVNEALRQAKIGHWPAMPYSEAIAEWQRLKTLRDSGVDPSTDKRQKPALEPVIESKPYTVEALCLEYLSGPIDRNRSSKSAANARYMILKGIKPISQFDPGSITRNQAFTLIEEKSKKAPVAASTLKSELGSAWEYAIDAGRLSADTPNWWRQILRNRIKSAGRMRDGKRTKTKRVLSDTEVGLLLRWLPHAPVIMRDVCTMYLWTGTRGAESMAMKGSEVAVEPDGVWWIVPKEKTKNARIDGATDLRVPLIGRALEIVTRRMELYGKGYLFPGRDVKKNKTQKVMSEMVASFQPYAQIKKSDKYPAMPVTHWALHDLRRTTRTKLAALGCQRDVAESIIGHVLGGVEGTYNLHAYDQERRVWLTRISDHFELCASNQPSVIE